MPNGQQQEPVQCVSPKEGEHNIVFISRGVQWNTSTVDTPLNGTVGTRLWSVTEPDGQIVNEGSLSTTMRPLDCFQWMFPMVFLSTIVQNTNKKLCSSCIRPTTAGELLKFFGVLILMTRFTFGPRRELWRRDSKHRYVPPAHFGRFMAMQRFEDLHRRISFCTSSAKRTYISTNLEDTRGEQARWDLCEGFLDAINAHRQQFVNPCEYICVDESISRWYGMGGFWLSKGLPHYVSIDLKPENGCEIQSAACGRSGICILLSFVKSAVLTNAARRGSNLNLGTRCLQKLCAPWFGTQRIVCADSSFASVEAATVLFNSHTRFIGVVKNATKKFPMRALAENEMAGRGDHRTMTADMETDSEDSFQIMSVLD